MTEAQLCAEVAEIEEVAVKLKAKEFKIEAVSLTLHKPKSRIQSNLHIGVL